MQERAKGIGLAWGIDDGTFTHHGENFGFRAMIKLYPSTRHAFVSLSNSMAERVETAR